MPYVLQIFHFKNQNTIDMVEAPYVNLHNYTLLLSSAEMSFLILTHVLIIFLLCIYEFINNA